MLSLGVIADALTATDKLARAKRARSEATVQMMTDAQATFRHLQQGVASTSRSVTNSMGKISSEVSLDLLVLDRTLTHLNRSHRIPHNTHLQRRIMSLRQAISRLCARRRSRFSKKAHGKTRQQGRHRGSASGSIRTSGSSRKAGMCFYGSGGSGGPRWRGARRAWGSTCRYQKMA